ncbi:MAG: hypothetical protein J1D77_08475 [Muribaculaceae bacterium]|nr:hypothetical protein [Muribaculaceae bacterium]
MNGGAFPLPVNEILGKVYSKLRNPTIAKLFRYVGIAVNAGYGMNKLASWETLTGTKPSIQSDRTIATISFPLKSAVKSHVTPKANDPTNDGINDGINGDLSENAIKVFMILKVNPKTTYEGLIKSTALSEPTATRAIKELKDKEHIKRGGAKKRSVDYSKKFTLSK